MPLYSLQINSRSRIKMDSKLELSNNLTRSKSLSSLEILDNVSNGLKVFQEHLAQIRDSRVSHISDADFDLIKLSADEHEQLNCEDLFTTSGDLTAKLETVAGLERKIERLSELLQEQQKFLIEIKKDFKKTVLNAPVGENPNVAEKNQLADLTVTELAASMCKDILPANSNKNENDRAQSLLDAIEQKHTMSFEREIKSALTTFLQSDALKDHVISATEHCVKDVIRSCFSQNFSASYLPMLERSHRRLLKHFTKVLEDTFKDLEENSTIFSKSVNNTTKSLRKALERHEILLDEADHNRNLLKNLKRSLQEVLQNELKEWRENLFNVLFTNDNNDHVGEDFPPVPLSPNYSPISPPQPADPERSILEQLMKSAEINKEIREGNVNSSFEKALSSSDLSLVMAACRAADPAKVFSAPCKLNQSVLLSLVQQLATDMVHDTQLKCRYLEEAIINLDTQDPITRKHLPTIVIEIHKHLTKFLKCYPSHVASRRVILIIMAAKDLLKLL